MTLTKIFCMTHGYQTLVREITTPILPTFVTSCLNLLSSKSSKPGTVPSSLDEVVFQSFAILVPRYTTIFRPFVSQIRRATRVYLAPTISDAIYTSASLKNDARRLTVVVHQTAPKNTGGEEWAKAVRELIQGIHATADQVFRAVIEDWESTTGYIADPADVNQELRGGGISTEDLPSWSGIHAGSERLTGMLELLADYFKSETSTPVTIPLGSLMDMTTRMLSISLPHSDGPSSVGPARLHPAIDRDEKDGLSSALPQIYVASLQLINVVADRMQENFLPLAQGVFDQLAWVFPYGKHDPSFRLAAYQTASIMLSHLGSALDNSQTSKATPLVKACCHDLYVVPSSIGTGNVDATKAKAQGNGSRSINADTFLRNTPVSPMDSLPENTQLAAAAKALLPLFLSHIPQQFVHISVRGLVERTAFLSHNKNAMLASILNPFTVKNGRALATMLPHLAREFPTDAVTEILLRPRMPLLPSTTGVLLVHDDVIGNMSEDEDMQLSSEPQITYHDPTVTNDTEKSTVTQTTSAPMSHPGLGSQAAFPNNTTSFDTPMPIPTTSHQFLAPGASLSRTDRQTLPHQDVTMDEADGSSDDESVHLTMQLDGDTEDEEE